MQFLFEIKKNVIVSERLLFIVLWALVELYDGESKLHFDDNDVRFVLDQHAEMAFLFAVLHATHLKGHTVKIQHSYFDC
jgi:hypothetical protein